MISPGTFGTDLDTGTAGNAGVFFCLLWVQEIDRMGGADLDTKSAGCTFLIPLWL